LEDPDFELFFPPEAVKAFEKVDDYLRGIHPNKKKEEKEEKTN
jgi:hypothetical protein